MATTMQLEVVSAERKLFSGTVQEVIAPGVLGDMGILPRHAQLLSRLRAGELRYKTEEGNFASLFVAGGFVEIQPHVVTVLADTGMHFSKFLLCFFSSVKTNERLRRNSSTRSYATC